MDSLRALSLLPFVPSGKEYDASRRLFKDLGFEEVWESGGYAGFRNGPAEFILQKFDNEAFAGNFMVRLNVADLDAWWATVSEKQLETIYPQFRIKAPQDFPWGREVNFIDLAGVCWHVGQRKPLARPKTPLSIELLMRKTVLVLAITSSMCGPSGPVQSHSVLEPAFHDRPERAVEHAGVAGRFRL